MSLIEDKAVGALADATVGAVCGALAGAERLPQSWTDPLGVQFHTTTLRGCDGVSVAELTARTGAVAA